MKSSSQVYSRIAAHSRPEWKFVLRPDPRSTPAPAAKRPERPAVANTMDIR
jgi:hypothetical protein